MDILRHMVESYLADCLHNLNMPERLREAMNYSLLAGGKRLRPVLCLLCASVAAPAKDRKEVAKRVLPFAAGLEMIHTYSLIHDDLPAMDDDDLRRGRPSCHKAFDEATAILAGDALLTDAFSFMARAGLESGLVPDLVLQAIAVVAEAAGGRGMVGGQMLDMVCTGLGKTAEKGDPAMIERLRSMQTLKTGALFRAACVSGGILGGGDKNTLTALALYAEGLGAAFQIIDDILDETQDSATLGKPAGSDAEEGKLTWPALTSLDYSRKLAEAEANKAVTALAGITAPEAETLRSLAKKLLTRVY